jgi:hypothetical protein
MAYPILHKAKIRAGVEQVGGDRVFQHMEMSRFPPDLVVNL